MNRNDAEKKVKELSELLQKYSDAYYLYDNPIVPPATRSLLSRPWIWPVQAV